MSDVLSVKVFSSLQKVFLNGPGRADPCLREETMLTNESFSFQVAVCPSVALQDVQVAMQADIPVRLRWVRNVPVELAAYPNADDNYISTAPGLYPDVLDDMPPTLQLPAGQWHSIWADIEGELQPVKPGQYKVVITFTAADGEKLGCAETQITVLPAALDKQTLRYTNWFHADCLAEYYGVEPLSAAHWQIMENFIALAVRRGQDTILTPVFTPPLDTKIGSQRMVVQLVEVYKNGAQYDFDFALLRRWVRMCLKNGIKYFEISHLFSQWGAYAAPNIMGTESGEYHRLFGWETPAAGPEYRAFLQAFIPALLECLRELGVDKNCYFHISDEPGEKHAESYAAAAEGVRHLLEGYTVLDALSDYAYYENGLVKKPIPATNHIKPFLQNNVPGLWTYYCCGQNYKTANRFMAMPSARNRIIGVQLYLHNIEGFLQWGYNFYHSGLSRRVIDPYRVTDADGAFPAGDAFMVYPGADGQPVESLRLMVFAQGLQDMRALQTLERLIGREKVVAMVHEGLATPITFEEYPVEDGWLIDLRRRVNLAIAQAQGSV